MAGTNVNQEDEQDAELSNELIDLTKQKYIAAANIKEFGERLKDAKLSKLRMDSIKRVAKLHFEEPEKRDYRKLVELRADWLGQLKDTPLGNAAIRAVR